jgi:hypothetical protein
MWMKVARKEISWTWYSKLILQTSQSSYCFLSNVEVQYKFVWGRLPETRRQLLPPPSEQRVSRGCCNIHTRHTSALMKKTVDSADQIKEAEWSWSYQQTEKLYENGIKGSVTLWNAVTFRDWATQVCDKCSEASFWTVLIVQKFRHFLLVCWTESVTW